MISFRNGTNDVLLDLPIIFREIFFPLPPPPENCYPSFECKYSNKQCDSFIRFNLFGFNCYGCGEKGGNEVAEGELYFCTETLVSFNYFYFSPSKSWQNVKNFFALSVLHASFHHLFIFFCCNFFFFLMG